MILISYDIMKAYILPVGFDMTSVFCILPLKCMVVIRFSNDNLPPLQKYFDHFKQPFIPKYARIKEPLSRRLSAIIAKNQDIGPMNVLTKRKKPKLPALFTKDLESEWWDLCFCSYSEFPEGEIRYLDPSKFSSSDSDLEFSDSGYYTP
jgi:hypothetical protein